MPRLNEFRTRLSRVAIPEEQVYLGLALVTGALVGLVVVAFILLSEHIGSRLYPPGSAAWRRLLVPFAGALITGFLLARYFPAARGSGIPQTKVAMLLEGGVITARTVAGRFLCSCAALASGIALGREGPSVQIGGGIASVLGRRIGLGRGRVRALIPVGAAAAVSAAFNTPISGVLFALEEVVGDLHAPVLGSAVVASGTAWVVLRSLLGGEPLFHVPQYELRHPLEFLIYAVLGLVGGLCSVAFVKMTLSLRGRFLALPVQTRWMQPAAGGLVVGVLALWSPQVLGVGYDYVGQVLNGEIAIRFVLTLLVLKLLATSACYASGNSGGIFGPSLFLGAMLGAGVGGVAHHMLPSVTANPGAYALVGMGAIFAGIVRAPLTSVFMIFELTRDYAIVVPLMIANMASFILSRRLQPEPIYEALALQDGIHLPRPARDREDSGLTVADIMDEVTEVFPAETRVEEIRASGRAVAVALTESGEAAVLTPADLERYAGADEPVSAVLRDGHYPHVHADHSVEDALERMEEVEASGIVVLDRSDVRKVLGAVTLQGARAAFRRRDGAVRADRVPR